MIEIPEGEFTITEVSAGHWQLIGKRSSGNIVEVSVSREDFNRIAQDAFEIESQISQNANKTAYIVIKANVKNISASQYHEQAFGSWFIEKQDCRVVFDGKEGLLLLQVNTSKSWQDEITYRWKNGLNFSEILDAIDYLK